jgi:hypothetical protein
VSHISRRTSETTQLPSSNLVLSYKWCVVVQVVSFLVCLVCGGHFAYSLDHNYS